MLMARYRGVRARALRAMALLAGALSTLSLVAAPSMVEAQQLPSNVSVFASGLNNPRGPEIRA
jgi:hypothetical protein